MKEKTKIDLQEKKNHNRTIQRLPFVKFDWLASLGYIFLRRRLSPKGLRYGACMN